MDENHWLIEGESAVSLCIDREAINVEDNMGSKEARKAEVKDSARQLFIQQNIENTTFVQIARKAGVGEATVYRYFNNKAAMALEIAVDYARDYVDSLKKKIEACQGGQLDKFAVVLDYYMELYKEKPDYFIYLENFDNYVTHMEQPIPGFSGYEQIFEEIYRVISSPGSKEYQDDSVRENVDRELAAHTYNITFLSLCQKLLIRGYVTDEDQKYDPIEGLALLREMMIESLRK